MARIPYVGTLGYSVAANCKIDVSAVTDAIMHVQKPIANGNLVVLDWSVIPYVKDGVTCGFQHITVLDDFDVAGIYKYHVEFTLGGWHGLGDMGELTVLAPFTKG
jgi:hypothetical protein